MAPPDSNEIRTALAKMLSSDMFAKARRMSRLLQFLVEKRLSDATRDTTEYGIGIEVFDRDPSSYNTGEDPIVRVQVGRLRSKLSMYYAAPGTDEKVVISIPVGNYMPVIRRATGGLAQLETSHLLALQPLKCLTPDRACASFAQGLSEELSCQLFKEFGNTIISHTFSPECSGNGTNVGHPFPAGASHLLEGSVRIDGKLIRTSVRLIDASAGSIAWSEQFDRNSTMGISLQEDLAQSICAALKHYFFHG